MSERGLQGPWSDRPWKRVAVYGLGVSGRAAARWLEARGVEVTRVDDRPTEAGRREPGVTVASPDSVAGLAGFDAVVVSPGVPTDRPLLEEARRRSIPVLGEVEMAFPFARGPVVGVTGSNGKSTTTALTAALLEAGGHSTEVCGNIGRPLTEALDGPAGRIFVTELSSFQLETVDTLRPRAAALLNVSADHLDRHGALPAYAAAKARLFRRQTAEDVAVFNADDPTVIELAERVEGPRRRYFSSTRPVADGCYLAGGTVVETSPREESETALFPAAALQLTGVHNLENAMASALLARVFGVAPEDLERGLRRFRGLPHRTQLVAVRGGVGWYDDSKGTNVAATARSLEGFADASVHLILGGRDKGAAAADLADLVERKARRLYVIGEAAELFARGLEGRAPVERCGDLATAVQRAARAAVAGDSVLLSPACASFDQYESYVERGKHFQALVGDLPGVADG